MYSHVVNGILKTCVCLSSYIFLKYFSVYSLDGIVVFSLLVICTCAYMKRVPRLKSFFLSEKKGFFGVFYKGQ